MKKIILLCFFSVSGLISICQTPKKTSHKSLKSIPSTHSVPVKIDLSKYVSTIKDSAVARVRRFEAEVAGDGTLVIGGLNMDAGILAGIAANGDGIRLVNAYDDKNIPSVLICIWTQSTKTTIFYDIKQFFVPDGRGIYPPGMNQFPVFCPQPPICNVNNLF